MDDEQQRLMEIFNEARAKASGEECDAYLTSACGDDVVLRRQVEILLKAHTQLGDFLKLPSDDPSSSDFQVERTGVMIGRYKLLEKIGEGGFGVVYMAEQRDPVQRKLALKIIKAGMDTSEVVARFEAERQALAMMDHPNIARVLDAGTTKRGRPYFVMELVNGIPITDYSDRHNLPMPERLELFMQVCHAVQHAHQKGIIHRDLKPTNVLVTLVDGKPVPKIIDFGVAKALGQRLTQKTLFTSFQTMIGTPTYMSPEQAELSGVDVDTRSDIYSLGVLLYELLTGATPFDVETLHKAGLDEIRRIIREMEPPKPSARLRTLGDRLTDVAQHRHIEPSALSRQVQGDLDWIVMKALEKERSRRYATAAALVEDLQRHLEHQPVQARPPGAVYRAQKFVRRHRMGAALVASVSMALIAGLVVALIGLAQARRERDHALQAEEEQREILGVLAEEGAAPRDMAPLFEEGSRIARERLGPDSQANIWLLRRLAYCYGSTGDWNKALELYRQLIHLSPDDMELWWSAHVAALAAGNMEICRELSAGMLARFGNSRNPWVLYAVSYEVLLSSDRPDHTERATELSTWALSMVPYHSWFQIVRGAAAYRTSDYTGTETFMEQALKDGDPGARCAATYFTAMARQHQGETESARELLKEADKYFEGILYAGNLGGKWGTVCENLFLRAEAERLILGREVSPPVTADSLATAYRKRRPILDHLQDGDAQALAENWTESAVAYSSALHNPDLNWNAETHVRGRGTLPLQMGAAFVKAGDHANHERLCRLVLDHQPPTPTKANAEEFALLAFMNVKNLPQDLQQRGLEEARIAEAAYTKTGYWGFYAAGMAESYAGDPEQAVKLLTKAEESGDLYCKGGAMACRAMALKKLGRDAQAAQVLQQAEALVAGPMERRLGGNWWDLEMCQLALDQARQLIQVPSKQ